MIKLLIIVSAVVAVIEAGDASAKPPVEIITESSFVREDGYDFQYKTSDGVSRKENGQLITVGEHKGIGVNGSYSYIAPDGQEYLVTFVADDKGYRPEIHTKPAAASGNQ